MGILEKEKDTTVVRHVEYTGMLDILLGAGIKTGFRFGV